MLIIIYTKILIKYRYINKILIYTNANTNTNIYLYTNKILIYTNTNTY